MISLYAINSFMIEGRAAGTLTVDELDKIIDRNEEVYKAKGTFLPSCFDPCPLSTFCRCIIIVFVVKEVREAVLDSNLLRIAAESAVELAQNVSTGMRCASITLIPSFSFELFIHQLTLSYLVS